MREKALFRRHCAEFFKQDGFLRLRRLSRRIWRSNLYITDEGLEMGRAQVVQAEAAGVKPSVLMNRFYLNLPTIKAHKLL